MRIYLSGPMTGVKDHNYPAFEKVATHLRDAGFQVESPTDGGEIPGWTWDDYMRRGIQQLTRCDIIVTLPGWSRSRGATFEMMIADGLRITHVNAEENTESLIDQLRELERPQVGEPFVEESRLAACPAHAVVVDKDGDAWQRISADEWRPALPDLPDHTSEELIEFAPLILVWPLPSSPIASPAPRVSHIDIDRVDIDSGRDEVAA